MGIWTPIKYMVLSAYPSPQQDACDELTDSRLTPHSPHRYDLTTINEHHHSDFF